MLKINLMGKHKIEIDNIDISNDLGSKAIALLGIIFTSENLQLSREKLTAYLWPDSDEEAAKYNLRFNLWNIKKHIKRDDIKGDFIFVKKGYCTINKEYDFFCDIFEIIKFKKSNENAKIEKLREIKDCFRGEFLEGLEFPKCEELSEKILMERIYLEKNKILLLNKIHKFYNNCNNYEEDLNILIEMNEIEPYDENIAREIFSLMKKNGNITQAINFFNSYSNKLAVNLSIKPREDFQEDYINTKKNLSNFTEDFLKKENEKESKKNICVDMNNSINIEYYAVSLILESLISEVDESCILSLDFAYIYDLACINRKMIKYLPSDFDKQEVFLNCSRDVCIVNAMSELLMHLNNECILTIKKCFSKGKIDEKSQFIIDNLSEKKLIRLL